MAKSKEEKATSLQEMINSAHIPAVSYACVLPNEDKTQFTPISIAVGKKVQSEESAVDGDTRFPASSLSKIVFTYLVLRLVQEGKIKLNEKLHDVLKYERFKVNGEYPERAKELTVRHVLSHTTGLPNVEPNSSSPPEFDSKLILGEGYSYSGEAILYLQKVIETKMSKDLGEKVDLEELAKRYVFTPLHMDRSTFLPQPKSDTNIVKVHSELGKPTSINEGNSELNAANAAGSLLTTAEDFSKFMVAWLKNMDDPIFQQAFQPTSADDFMTRGKPTCGLGWHIYKNKDEVIAYQYGENFNTRSFIAINVNDKKGAVFFTNSINGSSIANRLLSSPDLAPIGNMQNVFKSLSYSQSDEPGWQETLAGKIAEEEGKFEEARNAFTEALKKSPNDKSKQWRLEWFDKAHQEKKAFTRPLETFVGGYTSPYEEVEIAKKGDSLIYKQFGREIKLVQISETDFVPEKDQSFKISIKGDQISKLSIHGDEYFPFSKQASPKSQLETAREETEQYKDSIKKLRESQPGYMKPTESSKEKERKMDIPLDTMPKPPWKP